MAKNRKTQTHATPKRISTFRYGLVNPKLVEDLGKIFNSLPNLQYPINSAGELVEKLGGPRATIEVFGVPLSASRLAKGIPSEYFPIASIENFAEKTGRLLQRSRRQVNLLKELGRIRPHLPKMEFPLQDVAELLDAFKSVESLPATSPRLPAQHRPVVERAQINEWIRRNMRPEAFPIKTEAELYYKAMRVIPGSSHLRDFQATPRLGKA